MIRHCDQHSSVEFYRRHEWFDWSSIPHMATLGRGQWPTTTATTPLFSTIDQRCPWIGFIHGLDWIGLGPMTVMYKILTAYVFQRNRPRLFYAA